MVAHSTTYAFSGLNAVSVDVQAHVAPGMHAFIIVGLPDKVIAESRERIRTAFHAIGLSLPYQRITLSLSPADLPKEGSHYDLPMALALLAAMEVLPVATVSQHASMGELALDGRCRAINGCLPAAMAALASGLPLICPADNAPEALLSGIDRPGQPGLIAAPTLLALIQHLRGEHLIPSPASSVPPSLVPTSEHGTPTDAPPAQQDSDQPRGDGGDMADICGQEEARQALMVAAAGGHHLLMIGPPGAGKSMLASRLPTILPPLDASALLEVSMIASVAGHALPRSPQPPFRSPHHTSSMAALVGGGRHVHPGEISLAQYGVLFLDELAEFQRNVLEALREPLETGRVHIARANHRVTYPAQFQLIAAVNPCRCGHALDPARQCTQFPKCMRSYLNRLSGPLLDRFDIILSVPPVPLTTFMTGQKSASSREIRPQIIAARARQMQRQAGLNRSQELSHDTLSPSAHKLVTTLAEKNHLSARGFGRILRVARSLADLADRDAVSQEDIALALRWRRLPDQLAQSA